MIPAIKVIEYLERLDTFESQDKPCKISLAISEPFLLILFRKLVKTLLKLWMYVCQLRALVRILARRLHRRILQYSH